MRPRVLAASIFAACLLSPAAVFPKDILKLVIMAPGDPRKEGPRYDALSQFIAANSGRVEEVRTRIADDYPQAVRLFRSEEADGMFAGSFVAAVLIKKGLARPVVRPLLAGGISTYKALMVAKEGTKRFAGLDDFRGKRIAYCALASAGEVFVRSLLPPGVKPADVFTPVVVPSHEMALQTVIGGRADYAVVMDLVWNPLKYKGLDVVGEDDRRNPYNTLILTESAYQRFGEDLLMTLSGLEGDASGLGMKAKAIFGCQSFLRTFPEDFKPTLELVEKARVDTRTFEFAF